MIDNIKADELLNEYKALATTTEWRKRLSFLSLFLYTNRLQTACDKLDSSVSIKQWTLIIMVLQYENPPTLSQLSIALGCSRQNVKKLALVLEKKGYVKLERDEYDGRALVVKLTEKSRDYFDTRSEVQEQILHMMFEKLNDEEMENLFDLLCKVYEGIEEIEKNIQVEKLKL
ncbi:MAG TPA: MarR family transcriptional regulator [Clostridium sp.]|nr:MarR family transcriptional regulator [Clostridium sp.]